MRKRLYPFNGSMVPGEEVDFEPDHEPFATYQLADGRRLRVKIVLTKVVRLDALTEMGDPVYIIQSGTFFNSSESALNRGIALPAPQTFA